MDITSYLLGKNASGGGSKDEYNVFATVPEEYAGALTLTNSIEKVGTFDTSLIQNMSNMFGGCRYLKTVELLDTKNVTSFSRMFYNCTNIENIPQFDTTSVTDFSSMFGNIGSKLTDTSLNNILGMCINAVSYTGTKTLAALSLAENRAPKARLETLSNYQAFLDAGWTIGY